MSVTLVDAKWQKGGRGYLKKDTNVMYYEKKGLALPLRNLWLADNGKQVNLAREDKIWPAVARDPPPAD